MRRLLLLVLSFATVGCAPTLSGFQPAHVAAKGHVTVEAGLDVSAPVGTIIKSIDAGKTLAGDAHSRMLSDQELHQVFEAGANLALNPPAAVAHVGGTFVPFTDWELGLRWSQGSWRVGARHQFLDQAHHGFDLSAGLGVSRFTYEFPIGDVVDVLKLDDFQRWSIDVPIVLGTHGSWYRLWGGPRLLFSTYSAGIHLDSPATAGAPAESVAATVDGRAAYVGGQGGLAIGYQHVFLGFELTIVQLISTAHFGVAGQRQDTDLGGLVIYPGIALMGEL
jgi:hypothetical protein